MGKKVIIIGAGLSGLSAGCYAQINGFKSYIFEHHTVPGGVAAAWKRQGYLIDGGVHFIMGHKPGTGLHQIFKDLGVSDPSLYVDMVSYGRFINQRGGIDLVVGNDLDKLATHIKQLAPKDSATIDKVIDGAKAMQGHDLSTIGMSQPPELTSRFGQVRDLWQMRSLMKYFGKQYNRKIADFVKDLKTPWLKDFFCSLFLPESPTWFVMMVLALVADRQCAFLARGCLDFVGTMEKHYKALGGEATYQSTVDKILVENDRAVGIRLADGQEYRADYVVSAGDSYNAIFHLLEGHYVSDRIKKRHESWPLSRPFLMASYGVKREFVGDNPFSTVVLDEPITIGNEKVNTLFIRILNYSSRFAPAGKTVFQVEIETSFDYWFDLQARDRNAYNQEKKRVADEFLARVEKYYPGISAQVDVIDVATPYTTWRYTLNRKGAWGAWMMTSNIMMERIERRLPGLKNFYMAGQWVMCGGVPPSLYSGRHAIHLICQDDKKKFTVESSLLG
ncbi:phytoene desaturase family protein [Chloroflexota bacterium]